MINNAHNVTLDVLNAMDGIIVLIVQVVITYLPMETAISVVHNIAAQWVEYIIFYFAILIYLFNYNIEIIRLLLRQHMLVLLI